jgi:hypothetical protein
MDTSTFAQKIKAKYPAYQNVDDATLVNKFIEKYPVYKSQVNIQTDTGADISQTGSAIVNTVNKGVDKYAEIQARQDAGLQGGLRTKLQQLGVGAGTASGVIGDVVTGAVKAVLPQSGENLVKQGLSTGMKGIADLTNRYDEIKKTNPTLAFGINAALGFTPDAALSVKDLMNGYEKLKTTNPALAQDIDSALGFVQLGLDVTGIGETASLAKSGIKKGVQMAETGVKDIAQAGSDIATGASQLKDEAIQILAPKVDEQVKTVLQNTPTEKFDKVVQIAKESAANAEAPSTFEVVSQSMTDATKQLQSQTKSLAEQKATIIGKAKTGLADFTKETGKTILDINRKLKDSKIGQQFIEKLKGVKNKIDADKAIDEMQDILYKGNKDMTIPTGSKEDKILRGVLGEYNTTLKSTLPSSYGKINSEISNRLKAINILNRSLGETVNGVSTRGAGLVKRFFSPSGTQAKELFKYIKSTTGINLAEDATLAKYVADAFGDTKVKSLLEGLPTSKSGIIDKTIDFALEKTGVKDVISSAKTEGMIKKARSLTKSAK